MPLKTSLSISAAKFLTLLRAECCWVPLAAGLFAGELSSTSWLASRSFASIWATRSLLNALTCCIASLGILWLWQESKLFPLLKHQRMPYNQCYPFELSMDTLPLHAFA